MQLELRGLMVAAVALAAATSACSGGSSVEIGSSHQALYVDFGRCFGVDCSQRAPLETVDEGATASCEFGEAQVVDVQWAHDLNVEGTSCGDDQCLHSRLSMAVSPDETLWVSTTLGAGGSDKSVRLARYDSDGSEIDEQVIPVANAPREAFIDNAVSTDSAGNAAVMVSVSSNSEDGVAPVSEILRFDANGGDERRDIRVANAEAKAIRFDRAGTLFVLAYNADAARNGLARVEQDHLMWVNRELAGTDASAHSLMLTEDGQARISSWDGDDPRLDGYSAAGRHEWSKQPPTLTQLRNGDVLGSDAEGNLFRAQYIADLESSDLDVAATFRLEKVGPRGEAIWTTGLTLSGEFMFRQTRPTQPIVDSDDQILVSARVRDENESTLPAIVRVAPDGSRCEVVVVRGAPEKAFTGLRLGPGGRVFFSYYWAFGAVDMPRAE